MERHRKFNRLKVSISPGLSPFDCLIFSFCVECTDHLFRFQRMGCRNAWVPPSIIISTWAAFVLTPSHSHQTITCIQNSIPGIFSGKVDPIRGMTGILLAGMEARIVREDGTEADFHEPGELWVRGPNVTMGYWGNEEATRETFVVAKGEEKGGRWLRTGDRFRADEAGRFLYVFPFSLIEVAFTDFVR